MMMVMMMMIAKNKIVMIMVDEEPNHLVLMNKNKNYKEFLKVKVKMKMLKNIFIIFVKDKYTQTLLIKIPNLSFLLHLHLEDLQIIVPIYIIETNVVSGI
eukprot:UN05252